MLRNYLTVAIRNLRNTKLYSFINITGLAAGMACSILILLYVQDELSFDRYHTNADRIYRIVHEMDFGNGQTRRSVITPRPMAAALAEEFPEIEHTVRFMYGRTEMYHGERGFRQGFTSSDPGLFDIFDFPLIKGDPKTALSEPNTVVITEAIAKKYFRAEDPMGKVLTVSHGTYRDYKVTGILKEIPRNSHVQFDILTSIRPRDNDRWLPNHPTASWPLVMTYILLPKGYDPAELEAKLPDFVDKYMGNHLRTKGWTLTFRLQPLTSIYLHPPFEHDKALHGNMVYVYGFSAIACFILLIACINFMNLSTARSARRAREVGLRKTVGAHKGQLIGQFLSESLLMAVLAFVLALVLVELLLPAFSTISDKDLSMVYSSIWLAILTGILVLTGLIAGSYPAFFLSSFETVEVLKGTLRSGGRSSPLRITLVTVQFAITTTLLISTGVVYMQMDYARNKDLGVEKDNIVSVAFGVRDRFETIKQDWLKGPGILGAAASRTVPFRTSRQLPTFPVIPEGAPAKAPIDIPTYEIDYDYLNVFGIDLIAGRNFSRERFPADTTNAFVINESAVRKFGWTSPEAAINKQVTLLDRNTNTLLKKGHVIGVVKDFHMQILYKEITPLVLHMSPRPFLYLSVKVHPDRMSEALAFLDSKRKRSLYDYIFIDEFFENQYRADEKRGQILGGFTLLAITIACLGLFGLASFAAEQRTKEIGIRKVLGASGIGILLLLSKDFVKPVLLANLIAWPVAYYAMRDWLWNFAYRIDLGIHTFILGGLLALVIALATVSYQTLKAARANPVDALRYE